MKIKQIRILCRLYLRLSRRVSLLSPLVAHLGVPGLSLLARLLRFFGLAKAAMPELYCLPDNQVRFHQLYTHFGRVLVSRRWRGALHPQYFLSPIQRDQLPPSSLSLEDRDDIPWQEITRERYYAARRANELCKISYSGRPCGHCALYRLGLPCRCDFFEGSQHGYFQLVMESKQNAHNTTL
jgi:hypothetical protein